MMLLHSRTTGGAHTPGSLARLFGIGRTTVHGYVKDHADEHPDWPLMAAVWRYKQLTAGREKAKRGPGRRSRRELEIEALAAMVDQIERDIPADERERYRSYHRSFAATALPRPVVRNPGQRRPSSQGGRMSVKIAGLKTLKNHTQAVKYAVYVAPKGAPAAALTAGGRVGTYRPKTAMYRHSR